MITEPAIPVYCPGCGNRFDPEPCNRVAVGPPATGVHHDPTGLHHYPDPPLWGWDCWCHTCHWSGDISPDHDPVVGGTYVTRLS